LLIFQKREKKKIKKQTKLDHFNYINCLFGLKTNSFVPCNSMNIRTPVHSQVPSALRKATNGSNRSVRQPLSRSDSRRLSSNGRQAGTK